MEHPGFPLDNPPANLSQTHIRRKPIASATSANSGDSTALSLLESPAYVQPEQLDSGSSDSRDQARLSNHDSRDGAKDYHSTVQHTQALQNSLIDNSSTQIQLEPAAREKPTTPGAWWPFHSKPVEEKTRENYTKRFNGRIGIKHFRWVHHPKPRQDTETGGAAAYDSLSPIDADNGHVEQVNGKYVYLNQYRQRVLKYDDVAVYLSPTNSAPRRMVVQATRRIYQDSHEGGGDWIRTQVSGSVPIVLKAAEWALGPLRKPENRRLHRLDACLRTLLVAIPMQIMLAIPGLPSWEDEDVTDSYTEFQGYHWHWPKYAINKLDMKPADSADEKQTPILDVRTRRRPPRKLVVKKNDEWIVVEGAAEKGHRYVFISYAWEQFNYDGGLETLMRMSAKAAEKEGCTAYWLDRLVVEGQDGNAKDYDIYTICDVVRESSRVTVLLADNLPGSKISWGLSLIHI